MRIEYRNCDLNIIVESRGGEGSKGNSYVHLRSYCLWLKDLCYFISEATGDKPCEGIRLQFPSLRTYFNSLYPRPPYHRDPDGINDQEAGS